MDNNAMETTLQNIRSLVEQIKQMETAEQGQPEGEAQEGMVADMIADKPQKAAVKEDEGSKADAEEDAKEAEAEAKKAVALAAKAMQKAKAARKAVTVSTTSEAGTASDDVEPKLDKDNESEAEDIAATETKALLGQMVKALAGLEKQVSEMRTFKSDMQSALGISDTVLATAQKEASAAKTAKAMTGENNASDFAKAFIEQVTKSMANGVVAPGHDVDSRFARNSEVQDMSLKIAESFTAQAIQNRG